MQSLMYSADAWLLNIQVFLKQFSSLKNVTVLLKSLIFYNIIRIINERVLLYSFYQVIKSTSSTESLWFVLVCAELGSVAVLHPQVSCVQVSIWHQYLTFLAVPPRSLCPMSSLYCTIVLLFTLLILWSTLFLFCHRVVFVKPNQW